MEFDRTTEANQIVVLEKTDIYFVTSDMDRDNFYKKMKNLIRIGETCNNIHLSILYFIVFN